MPFELLITTKSDASELDVRQFNAGALYDHNLVTDGKFYVFQTVGKSVLEHAIYATGAKEVFSLWLDVLQALPDGQTITVWRVDADESGNLFRHTYVGTIENERLPRACKINRTLSHGIDYKSAIGG